MVSSSHRSHSARPARPLLPAGAILYRRDANHMVIGSNPGVVVRLRPGLLEALRLLDGVRTVSRIEELVRREVPEFCDSSGPLLEPLIEAGALRAYREPAVEAPLVALTYDESARGFAELLTAHVRVEDDPFAADVVAVVTTGEPAREILRDLTATGLTHVVVTLEQKHVHLGPLVVPGRTPCLDCFDRHHARAVPYWPVLVPQFGRQKTDCGVSRPTQLRAIAALLESLCSTGEPALIAARITFGPDGDQHINRFGFREGCGCSLLPT